MPNVTINMAAADVAILAGVGIVVNSVDVLGGPVWLAGAGFALPQLVAAGIQTVQVTYIGIGGGVIVAGFPGIAFPAVMATTITITSNLGMGGAPINVAVP